MNVLKIDHIGIAVKNLAESAKLYEMLGIASAGAEEVAEQKVKVCFFPVGDSEIELLESTSPDGPIAKYIEKNGEGIQHMALRVDDLEAALAELRPKAYGSSMRSPAMARAAQKSPLFTPNPRAASCWS